MFKNKKQAKKPYDYYKWQPKFCKYDGKVLLRGKDIVATYFNEDTGRKTERTVFKSYCEDWKTNRQLHTEFYGQPINLPPTESDKRWYGFPDDADEWH